MFEHCPRLSWREERVSRKNCIKSKLGKSLMTSFIRRRCSELSRSAVLSRGEEHRTTHYTVREHKTYS